MTSLPSDNLGKRLTMDSPEDISSGRPPRKRMVSSSRSSSPDDDQDETMDAFKEPLDIYRRDAISRQWREYVRSSRRLLTQVNTAEERKTEGQQQLSTWQSHFTQLKNDLQRLLANYALEQSKQQNLNYDTEVLLSDDWIDERTVNMNDTIKMNKRTMNVMPDMKNVVKSWSSKRIHFIDDLNVEQVMNKDLMKDYKKTLSTWIEGQNSVDETNHQYRISKLKYLLLTEELRLLKLRLGISENVLHGTKMELSNVENRLANKDLVKHETDHQQQLPSDQTGGNVISNEQGQMRTIMEHQQDPIVRAQKTLDQQLREIEMIKEQRIDMKQQIVQLELDLVQIPESRVYKSSICRQLHQSREYQRDKSQYLTGHVDKLIQDVEDMRRHRRRLMEEMDLEQLTQIRSLEEKLAKLEYELTRIRGQRDDLQCKIEMGKAKSQDGKAASVKEWQTIVETRKQRAFSLETEVARWIQKIAALTGSREFYQYVMDLRSHVLSIDSVRKEQSELEGKVSSLKQKLLSRPDILESDHKLLEEELTCVGQIKLLEDELETFKSIYGFDPMEATQDSVLEILQDKIIKEQETLTQYRQRVDVLQSTENQLLDEIGNIAKVYSEFDEQNMEKIKKLAIAEDEVIQLQCERVKYSQTFTALNKSKDALTMVANALTKQIEKQMTYIKQLNEQEKNLSSQIASLERQLGAGKSASDIYQQKVAELKTSVDDAKEKLNFAKDKVIEVEKSIMDKIRSIEEGAHSRLRMEENCELLWRKIEATTKVEKPAEMKLRKEKEEYRSLLNCSSCGTRLKSHVLMRCMHTFCKDCLDIRIETRQRRCPTCSEPFGINDVKQFYL
ncbi:uncharacterized protein BX664DRAFT_327564 [Halteromyces radiatus]|uniref:uncharacterized protein n=1 Tax=Halteromyces radiatus TaxID=101107 RepID=UPI0022210978|nr:uncharacterized protein BX664DRAFT_327564 [Halteromyces radiatus]KAI8092549.1 hypothetical protein BX664DRAFT_327564 [Halteromyces radiatus]